MLLKNMLEDLGGADVSPENPIPIPNVSFNSCTLDRPRMSLTETRQVNEAVLRKVVEWCEHHRNDPVAAPDDESDARKKTTDIEEWDQKFMQVDQEMLFEIILVCRVFFTDAHLGFQLTVKLGLKLP